MIKCKRCGHILTNPESIKRGYGKVCYRIVQLQKPEVPEINPVVNQEIVLLKFEIDKLKKLIRNIQVKGTVEPIERIRQIKSEQKVDGNEAKYVDVISELKAKFTDENFKNVYDLLSPPDGRTIIEAPPIILAQF